MGYNRYFGVFPAQHTPCSINQLSISPSWIEVGVLEKRKHYNVQERGKLKDQGCEPVHYFIHSTSYVNVCLKQDI